MKPIRWKEMVDTRAGLLFTLTEYLVNCGDLDSQERIAKFWSLYGLTQDSEAGQWEWMFIDIAKNPHAFRICLDGILDIMKMTTKKREEE